MDWRALAQPVLGDSRGNSAESALAGVGFALVKRSCKADHEQRCGLRFNGEICQHVAHERLLDQQLPKRLPMARVMDCLRQRLAHQSGSGNRAIKTSVVDHFNNGMNSSSLLAHLVRPRLRELNFTGRVGAVTHLVLESLDVKSVAFAGLRPARKQKAGKTFRSLCEDAKRIAHGRGTKPFVSGDQILARVSDTLSARG